MPTLPQSVSQFWVVMADTEIPGDLIVFKKAAIEATSSSDPRATFNKSMGQLKRDTPRLASLANYLDSDPTRQKAAARGASGSRNAWHQAIGALAAGKKAHVAFGANRTGHPTNGTFTIHDEVAAYVEHRRLGGDRLTDVLADVRIVLGNAAPEDRVVRRNRKQLQTWASCEDFQKMADVARWKYKLP